MDTAFLDRGIVTAQTDTITDPCRPRIAVFSDALPERNGAGSYYNDLAAQLDGDVECLEMFQPAAKSRLLRMALPLPGDPTQKLITPNLLRLWQQFRRLRPQVVVAVTPGPFGLLGLAFARRAGTGFLTGYHTDFERVTELYGHRLFFRAANQYLLTAHRILCTHSDAVMINNAELAPTVRRLGARHVEVVGTPLARNFLAAAPVAAPPALQRVLFAGRLAPEKNLPTVIDAARRMPDIDFVLAGDGPLRRTLQREAAALPNLRMTGWLDRESLRREMDAASLLLLPSHLETFGTVALEAMARGRPALVAENAGIHQWPSLGEALFTLHRHESLPQALCRLRRLPAAVWRQKGWAARRAAEALNRETARQWTGHFERYARRRDD